MTLGSSWGQPVIFSRWRVPTWSPFEDRRTHQAFRDVLHEQLREQGLPFEEREDGRVLALGGGATLDVAAAAQDAVDADPGTWPETARRRVASATNPNRPPSDPERLLPLVRTRLLSADALARFPKPLPHHEHGDLAEVLVVDASRGLVWAGTEDLAALGLELDELLALGRRNVREREQVVTTTEQVAGTAVTRLASPNAAPWALMLEHALEVPGEGVAVAVPTRAEVLALPLDQPGADDALDALAALAQERCEAGPGALSPRLYRYLDGVLTLH